MSTARGNEVIRWDDCDAGCLLGSRRAGGGRGRLRRLREVLGAQGRASAGSFQAFQCHAVAELGNADDGRISLVDKFPEA